jgi:hypothetical protein
VNRKRIGYGDETGLTAPPTVRVTIASDAES